MSSVAFDFKGKTALVTGSGQGSYIYISCDFTNGLYL